MKYKVGLFILAGFILIQVFRPTENKSIFPTENSILGTRLVPEIMEGILRKACTDCHSNDSKYPWYTKIQPIGWWYSNQIKSGKARLNFDEFGAYDYMEAGLKLQEIMVVLEAGKMPPKFYNAMHKDAILSEGEVQAITAWAQTLKDRLN